MTFYHDINPTIVQFFGLEIRWYGVMYVIAFLITYYYLIWASEKKKINITKEDVDDILLWLTIGLILGARVFEVLVYNPAYYWQNPLKIFAIWRGGLSFHGGLLGTIIAAWFVCKKKNIKLLNLADVCIVPLALGQALGRLGNFINGELYGRVTSAWWGVNFGNEIDALGNLVFRHPSQLYELSYDLIIFSVLFSLRNKEMKQGKMFAIFLMLYSVFRFLTELVREPDYYIGPLTVGQMLNIPMFLIGMWLIYRRE